MESTDYNQSANWNRAASTQWDPRACLFTHLDSCTLLTRNFWVGRLDYGVANPSFNSFTSCTCMHVKWSRGNFRVKAIFVPIAKNRNSRGACHNRPHSRSIGQISRHHRLDPMVLAVKCSLNHLQTTSGEPL